ncbi:MULTISPECIES: hypothetical protein [unclassified Xanthomonas]|uniref:hypothetical protein n=1 Tax=Xanthomonas sp. LMG 8992 TaxID=1591157 RepID=UPI00136E2E9B|nr:hypothetical protein [Xanthomonas sp. LMG 8992]
MKYYHYGPMSILSKVQRLGGKKGWEFIESEQNQSEGKPTACYVTRLSPQQLADNSSPVARVLGLKATEGDAWLCFEMDLPAEWNEKGAAVLISPIKGDRGKQGIALFMTKQKDYADSLDEGVDERNDYIYINRAYCTQIWTISTATGSGKEVKKFTK